MSLPCRLSAKTSGSPPASCWSTYTGGANVGGVAPAEPEPGSAPASVARPSTRPQSHACRRRSGNVWGVKRFPPSAVTPFGGVVPHGQKINLRLQANPLYGERRAHGLGKGAGESFRGLALLRQDPLAHPGRLIVAGVAGHPLQLLVAPDLEVLEGAHEGRQLAGGVGMAAEECPPVERPEPQGRILQGRRVAAERAQAFLDELRVIARLGEMVLVEVGE